MCAKMENPTLRRCVETGLSILVGSVGSDGVPSCCRGIAMTSDDDLASITVFVPVATSQSIISDVSATHRIAVYASHPVDHCSVQFKGTTTNVRLARASEAPLLRSRLDEFADILELIGLPRRMTTAMANWPAYAIEVSVAEIFDQTPGPHAGIAIQ